MKRTDAPPERENPFQSPSATIRVAPSDPHAENEFMVGVVLSFALALVLFLYHPLVGFMATIGVAIVVMRAWLEISRKQVVGWKLRRWDATWILLASAGRIAIAAVFGIGITGIASVAGAALFEAIPSLADRFSPFDAILVDGAVGLTGTFALLLLLGPASVETLRRRKLSQTTSAPNEHGGESRETN
ncbi:hypothetical protein LOC68_26845 [Blastopirellula sp. JC732]|uniref:Uncharacterized protein n=1 Tax=Blastopirellula sediminis TaxID=2894196 RepID=A0A9X1MT60_9BACT|nr:hypothetical protein [Blastopirellula sediminis]MCC9604674.1 hypothetical protein [Blastopirellula sediminis]MCC9632027.1 hypothetical protein [Blastopirellula sediminis]